MNAKTKRILLHLLFWLLAWSFLSWFFTGLTKEYRYTFLFSGYLLLIALVTTYFFNYFLIPRFLLRKRYLLFAALVLFAALISLWLEMLGILAIFLYLLEKFNSTGKGLPLFIDPVFLIAGPYLVIATGILSRLVRLSFRMQAENLKLENLRLETQKKLKEAELESLKSRFQPHFLFNTLNNLYWLTRNKSDQAPELVLKLSDLLDYSLYRSSGDRVPLGQELDFIHNYLDIMKIRFQETADIRMETQGDMTGHTIAPMILITFVENAFKHGLSRMEGTCRIHLEVSVIPGRIILHILNDSDPEETGKDRLEGQGLKRVKALLEQAYPDQYRLDIRSSGNEFNVNLELDD